MLVKKGLEGVEVDVTSIALVDGERGELSYRGLPVEQLIEQPFSRVVFLVLTGREPTSMEHQAFDAALARVSMLTAGDERLLALAAAAPVHPMQVLQGVIPLLDCSGSDAFEGLGFSRDAAPGLVIAAKLPLLVAGALRLRRGTSAPARSGSGQPNGEPNERFLAHVLGHTPSRALADAFRVTQILQIEHGFNASTFTARVVASTLAPVANCLAAACGALHGSLHGGADQEALVMADTVGNPARAEAFVDDCLARGRKIPGMGHREYKTLDPRARFAKRLAGELAAGTALEQTFRTLEAIEATFRERMLARGKSLHANLEFYKGVVYRAAGLPVEFFTPTFAMARVYGYVAHFIESRADNRIIRPAARYVGPPVRTSGDRAA